VLISRGWKELRYQIERRLNKPLEAFLYNLDIHLSDVTMVTDRRRCQEVTVPLPGWRRFRVTPADGGQLRAVISLINNNTRPGFNASASNNHTRLVCSNKANPLIRPYINLIDE